MPDDLNQAKQALEKAEEILVLLPQNPGPDTLASALALHIALKKAGKSSHIACGTPLDFEEYPLRQASDITQKIGNKNLVISLKIDNRDSVDKVSYNLDEANKVFNLIVSPKKGSKPLSSEAVSYSLSGAAADVVITVGANSFDELGSLYADEPSVFSDLPTIAINRLEPSPFATYHLNNPQKSSIAEFEAGLLEEFGLQLDKDSATNLMAAIDVVTDKLQLMNATASTFETVAKLMRAGAARIMLQPAQEESEPEPEMKIEPKPEAEPAVQTQVVEEVPEDWLAPKIFKAPKSGDK